MKKSMLLIMGLIVVLVMAACGSKSDSGSGEGKGTYKIGIDVTYPPFEFEKGGKTVGIDVDLINAIAKDQDFKVKLEAMDFSGIIPAMQAGQLDVGMGGMSITDERKKKVDFSDPYFDAGLTVVVKKDSSIKSIDDLKGKKLAVKNGTTGAKFATDNADKYGYEVVQFNDSPSMFQEVSNGNADALIEDYPVITYAIAQQDLKLKTVGDRLNGDQYGISVMKGKNQDLLKKINKGLENLKKNGEYDKIIEKYLKS
ncbi:transporter substrate-binding domain-containing protein [Bacillus altitudinis]|jgi:glutamine transport system substrate-binding protein|uniref:Glutamine transporter subunit periplasmic binding component of ABC superfamily n=2 Tax=Bacillus TaxID=1386 RepID=A0A653XR36_BACAB|nr:MULTISPECIES: transporter substrate-binding domain-containing protein [Bacillus]AMM90810.1 glutamine ABC transporter substrate-binding protein [Bacillus pumilus]EMI14355.1 extracellular solute-binding protein [Bacillus stratosphericus LAMA 585]KML05360.1 glutamine ABC transporter substrate-binding protein [Bacillus stratosphericus]MDH8709362.1 glutamine transport system substrate-binding protein [Micromonospora sp. 1209]MDN0040226.1 transporter substrate-binding domain-containing protein [B